MRSEGHFVKQAEPTGLIGDCKTRVVLISTYELGHQPFGLASPAAWLRQVGAEVICQDLSLEKLDEKAIEGAELVAFYLPMHTATRIAVSVVKKIRGMNPSAHLCAYGLYAPVNADYLRELGFRTILGGEFEEGLVSVTRRVAARSRTEAADEQQREPQVSLARQRFLIPDRSDLPVLSKYAFLTLPDGSRRIVGYTEASRGCKHLCRHCPIVPIYKGKFRIVQRNIVLEDIRRQIALGARHITFGDPDFFNGIKHAITLVQHVHSEFPSLSYDVTIKVEHLLKYADYLPLLRDTGCAFVTSAVESVDDEVLKYLDKGHTKADFLQVVELFRNCGLVLAPTFVAFNPWTTLEGYGELLQSLAELDLVENVAPIQLAIRLLIPSGSRMLELPEIHKVIGGFDSRSLCYRWRHPDPRMDSLQLRVQQAVEKMAPAGHSRRSIFEQAVRELDEVSGGQRLPFPIEARQGVTIPYLSEPWYCCAEPTEEQVAPY